MMRVLRLGLLPLLLANVGCAYDPPMAGDHAAPKYQADLDACTLAAEKYTKSLFYLFITYPISLPIEERARMATCMEQHGYTRAPG
jgi:hypothetical protein